MTIDNDYMTVDERIEQFVQVLNAYAALGAATNDYSDLNPFYLDKRGKKYARVIRDTGNQRFVDCFIELATGRILKDAGWSGPAKDKNDLAYRWDLMDHEDRHLLFDKHIDQFGTNTYLFDKSKENTNV